MSRSFCRKMDADLVTDMQSGNTPFYRKRREYAAWAVLIGYTLLLVYRAHRHGVAVETVNIAVWELPSSRRLARWISAFILWTFCESGYFVPLGFIAALVVPRGFWWLRRVPVGFLALAMASGLTVLVHMIETVGSGHQMAVADLVFPLFGSFFGLWSGMTWRRGWRMRLWLLPKVAFFFLGAVLTTGIVAWLLLEDAPLSFEAALMSFTKNRGLVKVVQIKDPNSQSENRMHILRLTENDLNVLISRVLSFRSPEQKARVHLDHDSVSLMMSVGASLGRGRLRYLNLEVDGGVKIEDGILRLHANRCRIGSQKVPRLFLPCLSTLITSQLNRDPQVRLFLQAAREMVIEPNLIQLTWDPLDLPARLPKNLFRCTIVNEELFASIRTQVDHMLLLLSAGQTSGLPPSFSLCLETAFAVARTRSTLGNPVTENQAAILALGMLLGHPGIEDFVGPVLASSDRDALWQVPHQVVLRGRSDWTRHFCISAVIVVLSDETVSDAAGLLKEETDIYTNDSGFSFADLLADRAGATFAVTATRDEAAARTMQNRLTGGFHIDEIFPPADDLPEGISHSKLQSDYGGVGGEGYRRLVNKIDRCIAACAAYQD
jgi:hypothetical protein